MLRDSGDNKVVVEEGGLGDSVLGGRLLGFDSAHSSTHTHSLTLLQLAHSEQSFSLSRES